MADEVVLDTYTTYLEDGSYIVTEIAEEASDAISGMNTRASAVSKTGSKTTSRYNSFDELLYSLKVTAVRKVLFVVVDRSAISVTLYCDYNEKLS